MTIYLSFFMCTYYTYSQAGDPLKIPPLGVVKMLVVGGSPSKASSGPPRVIKGPRAKS